MDQQKREAIEIGETTMLADMMKCIIGEMQAQQKPWQSMSKDEQDEALERIEKQIRTATDQMVNIVSCSNMDSVMGTVDSVKFKGGAQAVIKFAQIDKGVHALADAEGHFVKIIITETEDLMNNSDKPVGEPDQRGLDLGHEYDDSEESHPGTPFIGDDHSEAEEALGDALAEVGTSDTGDANGGESFIEEPDAESTEEPDGEQDDDAAENQANDTDGAV